MCRSVRHTNRSVHEHEVERPCADPCITRTDRFTNTDAQPRRPSLCLGAERVSARRVGGADRVDAERFVQGGDLGFERGDALLELVDATGLT